MRVSFLEALIYSAFSRFWRLIITVVNDRSRHATEHRLDDIQELRSCRQWRDLHYRILISSRAIQTF